MLLLILPQHLAGLGIFSIHGINRAALMTQVWHVIGNHPTCLNLWVYAKYLRKKSFWDVKASSSASWCWRGILSLRPMVLPYIRHLIGDGRATNFWLVLGCKMVAS